MSKNRKTFREKELFLEVARSIVKRSGFFSFLERFQFSRQNKIKKATEARRAEEALFEWLRYMWIDSIYERLYQWSQRCCQSEL